MSITPPTPSPESYSPTTDERGGRIRIPYFGRIVTVIAGAAIGVVGATTAASTLNNDGVPLLSKIIFICVAVLGLCIALGGCGAIFFCRNGESRSRPVDATELRARLSS